MAMVGVVLLFIVMAVGGWIIYESGRANPRYWEETDETDSQSSD